MAPRIRSHAGVSFPSTHFVMDPTPEQLRQDLLLLERKMGDYRMPLQFSKQILIGSVTRAFVTETDPITGKGWPRLSASAQRVPRAGKLRRTKTSMKMYRNVTNPGNWGTTKDGVYLNASRLPKYYVYHQQDDHKTGTDDVLQLSKAQVGALRARVDLRTKQVLTTRMYEHLGGAERHAAVKAHVLKQEGEKLREEAGLGRAYTGEVAGHGQIPQRRFIGVDAVSVEKIKDVMDKWARDVIIIYKRGKPGVTKNIIVSQKPGMK